MPIDFMKAQEVVEAANMSSLKELGLKLLKNGPYKVEKTSRRVRVLFASIYIFDTTEARHVWEHPYYPHYYVPSTSVKSGLLSRQEYIDTEQSAYIATLGVQSKTTDRVLGFEKGPLAGLILDAWFEEDLQIYGHPKDPCKRIDILPSSRRITISIDGVKVAESDRCLFLLETTLRTRYYMPKTSANFELLSPSEMMTLCPYKGMANYYNVTVNGKVHQDVVWWYKYPTSESAPIAGHLCFYNEKVDVFVDGVKEA